MAELVDGKKIAKYILSDLRQQVQELKSAGIYPRLIVVLVGQNAASLSYIRVKQKRAEEIGLKVDVQTYPDDISQSTLQGAVQGFNSAFSVCGILVQLPLPPHLDKPLILDSVAPELDVDCLTSGNQEKLIGGQPVAFLPPAAAAIMKILDYYKIDLKNSNILIVGSGDLVGKPLAAIFLNHKINFKLANRYTEDLSELTRNADVVITAVGKPGLITGTMIKTGAVVIDAGTTGSEGGDLSGDVETKGVALKARLLAPVPGGVGPVTVAMLLQNAVKSAFDRYC